MASKDDLMASLMGGGSTADDDPFGTVVSGTPITDVASVSIATEMITPTVAGTDKLFDDDDDDDPPPFTTESVVVPIQLPSTLLNGTSNSLFGNDISTGADDTNNGSLFADIPEPDNTDVSSSLPALPNVPPPPLPPVPPPAAAPPPPTPISENVGGSGGGGLFDDIDDNIVAAPVLPHPAVVSSVPKASAGLAESGLLGETSERVEKLLFPKIDDGTTTGENTGHDSSLSCMGGKGGLFDDVDQLEAENAERERQRQKYVAEEEAKMKAAEAERARQVAEAEQMRVQNTIQQQQLFEQQERMKREQLDNIYYTQSVQDQMQSIHLGTAGPAPGQQFLPGQGPPQMMQQNQPMMNGFPHPQGALPPGQQQHQSQLIEPPVKKISATFYRDPEPVPGVPNGNNMPQQQFSTTPRYYQPEQSGNFAAGLHNTNIPSMQQSQQFQQPQQQQLQSPRQQHFAIPAGPPPSVTEPLYGRVSVSDPILVQSDSSFFGVRQPPHWNYQITSELTPANGGGGIWIVRRRFRHVVSLEDRLREDCPGAILPPRPDKHATRAIEEASASQSLDFAMQRAAELQVYLNEIVHHPICYKSPVLRLFLALQDDLGIAWAECSGNAFTRLANVGVGAALKVSESSAASKLPWQSTPDDLGGGEDNAELLALQSAESIRMGMVQQAVPKLEGAVTLLREFAELSGSTGMELSRLVKELQHSDIELAQPIDIVSAGLLRSGRRSKRLAIECAAAIYPYQQHYKMCRYEKFAFQDRKNALQRRHKERMKADQRAAQLLMHQRAVAISHNPNNPYQNQQQYGYPYGDRVLAQEAATADMYATDVWNEADEIGQRLKSEVYRCAWSRRSEWAASLKVIASSMKEAMTERAGIWETIQENFLQAFPEYKNEFSSTNDPANIPIQPTMMNGGVTSVLATMPQIGESVILPSSPILQSQPMTNSMLPP